MGTKKAARGQSGGVRGGLIPLGAVKNILVTLGVILAIGVLFDLSPYGGNIRYYTKWASCQSRPISAVAEFGFGASPPSYDLNPPLFHAIRFQPEYFCTPLEAERAGYSASSSFYDFPHLDAVGEQPPERN